jgi:tetratricopeptide (TPR) repeat protein
MRSVNLTIKSIYKVVILVITLSLCSFAQTDKSAEEYYNDGIQNIKSKAYLKAIGDFTHAISLKQDFADAYFQRAIAKELFGQQIGFFNPELCTDLIEAAKMNHSEAIPMISKLGSKECQSMSTAFLDAEMTYCADFNSKILNKIPELTKTLKNLTHLNLWNNRITELEYPFEFLPYLVSLNVSSNQINKVGASIGKIKMLYELNLSKNDITTLPEEIGNLNNLHTCILRGNRIIELPASLKKINSLHTLDLSLNNLEKVPQIVSELTMLKVLILSGNPLQPVDIENIRAKLPNTEVIF